MPLSFNKVLIANRGEIACRIIRSCRELGLASVAVHSNRDAAALYVDEADEAVSLDADAPGETYLDIDKLITAAKRSGAGAVHPGYGFLAENARFARTVGAAGLVWIGPAPATIEAMGDKSTARALAEESGVPTLKGSRRFSRNDLDGLEAAAATVGYPLLVKATGGGGGIGMNVVTDADGLERTVAATQEKAGKFFGDDGVILEPYLSPARHIEVQIFGFGDGRAVHLFERDCSIQRRFQKVVEEAPAPRFPQDMREAMTRAAVRLAESQRYAGAGTVEFLFHEETGRFFFLELNTRIQVEHGVSETITGLDLVAMQIRQAGGDDLSAITQAAITMSGHAIEARLCAEDPSKNFRPSPGTLRRFEPPATDGSRRIDTGYRSGDTVSSLYDSLLAKVIGHGRDREAARAALQAALDGFEVEGIVTNKAFLRAIAASAPFADADLSTGFLQHHADALSPRSAALPAA